jgi:hypothetical protein
MIDVAYENVIAFDMLDKTLDGRELLESKVSQTVGEGKNKRFENVLKLYFDLDNLEEKKIYIESEKYVDRDLLSNKKYLLFNPSRAGAFEGVTTNYIHYLLSTKVSIDKKTKEEYYEPLQIAKFSLLNLYKSIGTLQEILLDITSFYHYSIEDKNVILKFITNSVEIDSVKFFNQFKSQNIFTIGYIKDNKKYLLCDDNAYMKYLLDKQKNSLDESKLKVEGICDFCKKSKKLIDNFGAGNFPLKHLKNFTSTMPSVFYNNDKKTLNKNIRCCVKCFTQIAQADYKLSDFQIGTLKEECINCKNKQIFTVYAFIDTPFKQDIDYENIKYGIESLFGYKNMLDTAQNVVRSDDIFDEDWEIILNLFIAKKSDKINQSVLNLRNINPHLFRKYHKIFEFINELNQELTYRKWKGNFADIFSTISKADKRVSFDIFESFLNEKAFDKEGLIERFLPFVKRKFIASIDEKSYQQHYRYLLLDIANILIIDNLRKKENILSFEMMNLIESYEDKNKKKRYRRKETKEIVTALGFEWSSLEIGLFDLGMIIQESVSNIKQNKSTDIEKVFMRKMDFTGMRIDEVMSYIGYMEQKFQDYRSFIYQIDNKRERLAKLGMELNQKELDISPQKSAYLIAFGYEMSLTISNKIGNIVNQEKEEKK